MDRSLSLETTVSVSAKEEQRSRIAWWTGWTPLFVLPVVSISLVPPTQPRWVVMWALSFAIYVGCKWLTWRRTPSLGVPLWKHVGYLLAWPGLDAPAFLSRKPYSGPRPCFREWLFAVSKILLGIILFWGIARLVPDDLPYAAGWIGMIGFIFFMHFGLFHLLSRAWRSAHVDARPLMIQPLASESVSEFWGRRWNTAFRDLTHRFLFRPLTKRIGAKGALAIGFVFSGLVHDAVISIPAGGGFGGPTVYFLIQGLAVFIERGSVGRALGLGTGWRGRLFTFAVLAGPAPLLFHAPFVEGVVIPFMRFLGAL